MGESALFHAFQPHDQVEILDVDHNRTLIAFRSTTTGLKELLPYPGLDVVRSTLIEGRVLPVRFGAVTPAEAQFSREGRVRRGARKISDMAHLAPTITPLALSLLRWELGDHACAWHLERFATGAGTHQKTAEFHGGGGRRLVTLDLAGGCVKVETAIDGARIEHHGIHLDVRLPDLVAAASEGQDVRRLIDHPALVGTIARVTTSAGGTQVDLKARTMTITDAIASIPRLARAA